MCRYRKGSFRERGLINYNKTKNKQPTKHNSNKPSGKLVSHQLITSYGFPSPMFNSLKKKKKPKTCFFLKLYLLLFLCLEFRTSPILSSTPLLFLPQLFPSDFPFWFVLFPATHQVPLVPPIYALVRSLSGFKSLKITSYPSPSIHQWPIDPQLRVGLLEPIPHLCREFGWLDL